MISRKILKGLVAVVAATSLIAPSFALAADEGDLIKAACDFGDTRDSCNSVYYLGLDSQRHLFPNEDVYYSWFDNFNGVNEIDESELNGFPLGKNVTLKPGTSALKFVSDGAVYAVEEGGVLRHYLTPALVAADYGNDWSTNDLVIMPDELRNDYTEGEDIDSASDYDPDDAENGVISIDDNF